MLIEIFDAFRSSDGGSTENPDSTSVYAKIRLSMENTSSISTAKLYLRYSSTGFFASNVINKDISSTFGVTSTSNLNRTKTISLGTFSKTSDWYFVLDFYTNTENATVRSDVVARTNVPLFIADNNQGVAIGQYSTATASTPKFESNWPAFLYGGIANLGLLWTELTPVNGSTPGEYGGGILKCAAIDNLRIVEGSVLVKPGSSTIVIANLPSVADWAPGAGVFAMNACQGARIARIAVGGIYEENAGKLALSWVRDLSDGELYTSSAIWVQCSIMYWMPTEDYG